MPVRNYNLLQQIAIEFKANLNRLRKVAVVAGGSRLTSPPPQHKPVSIFAQRRSFTPTIFWQSFIAMHAMHLSILLIVLPLVGGGANHPKIVSRHNLQFEILMLPTRQFTFWRPFYRLIQNSNKPEFSHTPKPSKMFDQKKSTVLWDSCYKQKFTMDIEGGHLKHLETSSF